MPPFDSVESTEYDYTQDTWRTCEISSWKKKNHTTFHKVRIKWHGVSASITVEDRTLSNKDTGGTAAFQRE